MNNLIRIVALLALAVVPVRAENPLLDPAVQEQVAQALVVKAKSKRPPFFVEGLDPGRSRPAEAVSRMIKDCKAAGPEFALTGQRYEIKQEQGIVSFTIHIFQLCSANPNPDSGSPAYVLVQGSAESDRNAGAAIDKARKDWTDACASYGGSRYGAQTVVLGDETHAFVVGVCRYYP